ncbi:Uu.00g023280.m01.CDS01 [Anthostomella pinea]|uniref:Uu.00g023280.m01.CDS01 n=1 Tax=Anthostomella pinea TaxID=933095 RepID=A0AAI8YQX5_9PEZI|nr:Uu.00g023280.m01.CDS01 [Anthostomella pinea]
MPRAGQTTYSTSSSSSTASAGSASGSASTRQRKAPLTALKGTKKATGGSNSLPEGPTEAEAEEALTMSWAARNQWVVLAIASGACAAFNGVFAKLTTNGLTTDISQAVSVFFGLGNFEKILEVVVRCGLISGRQAIDIKGTFQTDFHATQICFGLNLVFNGIMWTLFTQALAKGTSTTQVSIMNTSTNFMITAVLGFAIFAESLPPLWWAGAALLVAGNVIIGRKDETVTAVEEDPVSPSAAYQDEVDEVDDGGDAVTAAESGEGLEGDGTIPLRPGGLLPVEKDEEDEDVALLGDLDAPSER